MWFAATTPRRFFMNQRLWVLIANRTQAFIFEYQGQTREPLLIVTFKHPAGNLKARDLESDRPGRSFSPLGPRRHGFSTPVDPGVEEMNKFARELTTELDRRRSRREFDLLAIAAGPSFLGVLRENLTKQLEKCLAAKFHKELVSFRSFELLDHLKGLEDVWRASEFSESV
jgi:protein required for attachment to host cells